MSFTVSKTLYFPHTTLNYAYCNHFNDEFDSDNFTLGGILSDTKHVWQAKGPYLEVRDSKRGSKVGSWTFGCILKDSSTKIIDVKELQKSSGKLALLVVALDCTISGGIICLFNIFSSKVIRSIQVKERISNLSVVDSGVEVLNLPGPLHDFDGIIAVGTEGGNVFLIDICRQICEESLMSFTIRDELLPSQLSILTPADTSRIDYYRERAVRKGNHLAIHLNIVLDRQTEHFSLKGPKGEVRLHVNRQEVCTSALYYCNQLTSLLVGFNFGAFQLWDLTSLQLTYTSPVCDEHIPITHFALQEPTDDPRAFCYIWISYSNTELYQTGLPFAVMYAICYESKEYHEGYGYLYQNFQYCAIRFQVELGSIEDSGSDKPAKGGLCINIQPVSKFAVSKNSTTHHLTGETLALCIISWTIWHKENKAQSNVLIFDLNQWYKEQMPSFTKWSNCNNYILRMNVTGLIAHHSQKLSPLFDVKMDETSLRQFIGVQRLEEHFSPTSLSFNLWLSKENELFSIHSEGLQQALLQQIQTEGPLCLLRPTDIFQRLITIGLTPVFSDVSANIIATIDVQRETILNVALEHRLLNWLCKCASEWANGRFSSAGCTIDSLFKWAFQRTVVLKTQCDKFCAPLFDYSQSRLDNNTNILLNSCTGQITVLYKFYNYIINNLSQFISYMDLAEEQRSSLEMVAMYFEVLQWMMNVGLLPECHPSSYPRPDNTERISAPYPVKQLTHYYNEKRANLQLLNKEQFASSDNLLFIDNLINYKLGAELLQKQWQEDGGSGLYPPPSLQSLLRTYLIPNASITHKHSLVLYLFLDLAMALDQSKYSPVITYLIKFPAVFKVSTSIIKITQAFWQLDHGDHSTAIEQLLDHFVLKEDLQLWHHNIAMNSLLIQNQHKAALRYMQVRKPPMADEKSILTAISLYIKNNMVTEAFDFSKEHRCTNHDKFLYHLFNECNKIKTLHVMLYKCLDECEEKSFLQYLEKNDQPKLKNLQVFYYLLRSRFLEAFEAHSKINRKDHDTRGLIGQKSATHVDQIVRIFKNGLPEVNRELVEYIRKESNNLWKEIYPPTPMSVFIHDTQEKIQYKSTLIHAALSKAKGTFHNATNYITKSEVLTEETPFLKTPTTFRTLKRENTPVITPKVINLKEDSEDLGPSPPKRRKLSHRSPTISPNRDYSYNVHCKLVTPIVKRKTSTEQSKTPNEHQKLNVCTPQSILKVRSLVRHADPFENTTLGHEDRDTKLRVPYSMRSNYNLQARPSLSRSRQHVQFEDTTMLSSSLSDQSVTSKPEDKTSFDGKFRHTLSDIDVSTGNSSKNSTNTTDEFYSPDSSIDDNKKLQRDNNDAEEMDTVANAEVNEEKVDYGGSKSDNEVAEDVESKLTQSPRARRSYKRSLTETTPVRSSPRLLRNNPKLKFKSESSIDLTKKTDDSSLQTTKAECGGHEPMENVQEIINNSSLEETLSISNSSVGFDSVFDNSKSPRLLQRIKGRKSLTRKVLEHNSFLRMLKSSTVQTRTLSNIENTSTVKITKNDSKTITIEPILNVSDTVESETRSPNSARKRISTNLVSRKSTNTLSSSFADTSTESSYSFQYEPDPLLEDCKLSDSLVEWVSSLKGKSSNSQDTSERNEMTNEEIQRKIVPTTEVSSILGTSCSKNEVEQEKNYSYLFGKCLTPLKSEINDNTIEMEINSMVSTNKTKDTFNSSERVEKCVSPTNSLSNESKLNESDENEDNAHCRSNVYQDLSSGSEELEEVLRERRGEKIKSIETTTPQLNITEKPQEVICLDTSDSEDNQKDNGETRSSSDDEEENLNRAVILEENLDKSTKRNDKNSVIEISDTGVAAKVEHLEERQEVALFSQLEENDTDEEDFSWVYRDLEDETQAVNQALEAEMNEPTYTLDHISGEVFDEVCMEKEVYILQTEPTEGKEHLQSIQAVEIQVEPTVERTELSATTEISKQFSTNNDEKIRNTLCTEESEKMEVDNESVSDNILSKKEDEMEERDFPVDNEAGEKMPENETIDCCKSEEQDNEIVITSGQQSLTLKTDSSKIIINLNFDKETYRGESTNTTNFMQIKSKLRKNPSINTSLSQGILEKHKRTEPANSLTENNKMEMVNSHIISRSEEQCAVGIEDGEKMSKDEIIASKKKDLHSANTDLDTMDHCKSKEQDSEIVHTKTNVEENCLSLKIDSETNTANFTFDKDVSYRDESEYCTNSKRDKSKSRKDQSTNSTFPRGKPGLQTIEEFSGKTVTKIKEIADFSKERTKSDIDDSSSIISRSEEECTVENEERQNISKDEITASKKKDPNSIKTDLHQTIYSCKSKEQNNETLDPTTNVEEKCLSLKTDSETNTTNFTFDKDISYVDESEYTTNSMRDNSKSRKEDAKMITKIKESVDSLRENTKLEKDDSHLISRGEEQCTVKKEQENMSRDEIIVSKKKNLNSIKTDLLYQTIDHCKSEEKDNEIVDTKTNVEGKCLNLKTASATNTTNFTLGKDISCKDKLEYIPNSMRDKSKSRKDQSTNTTLLRGKSNLKTSKESSEKMVTIIKESSDFLREKTKLKMDDASRITSRSKEQCTTTTLEVAKEYNDKKSEIADDSFEMLEKPIIRRVYKSRKSNIEDQYTSSSDTTEGESDRQDIIVTAQVHTPSRKVEVPLIKRLTRRRSQHFSADDKTENLGDIEAKVSLDSGVDVKCNTIDLPNSTSDAGELTVSGIRTRKSSSVITTQPKAIKTRRSSHSDVIKSKKIDCDLNNSKEILEDSKPRLLLRKTRSVSVDDVKTYARKRSLRSTKTDESEEDTIKESESLKSKIRTKANSISYMPVINEEKSTPRKRSRAGSAIETYATSRRLTRGQANIVKSIPTHTERSTHDDSEVEDAVEVDDFDPINLLDKEAFKGEPDPEEQRVYEDSSPSTGSISSVTKPKRRKSLSASRTSDVAPEKAPSETSPRKLRSVARTLTMSPAKSVKTRPRRLSETVSVSSEKSEQISPPKRSRKKPDSDDVASNVSASSRISRRSRNSSDVSVISIPQKELRRNTILSKKHNLPNIAEENAGEILSSKDSKGSKKLQIDMYQHEKDKEQTETRRQSKK